MRSEQLLPEQLLYLNYQPHYAAGFVDFQRGQPEPEPEPEPYPEPCPEPEATRTPNLSPSPSPSPKPNPNPNLNLGQVLGGLAVLASGNLLMVGMMWFAYKRMQPPQPQR